MDEEWTDEQRVLAMALQAFKTTGLDFTVLMGDGQFGIRVDDTGLELRLTNMMAATLAEPESEWPRHVEQWLAAVEEIIARVGAPYTEDDLRAAIRTRLYRTDENPGGLSYARPFAEGLVLGLAIDSPRTVAAVTTGSLAQLPLDLETLFELGQASTDLEPIEETFDVEESRCGVLAGRSHFVASRAANLPTLFGEFIEPAPYGLAFGVPNRHTLIYKVIDKELWVDVIGIASLVDGMTFDDRDDANPGGVLSPYLYYRAPDGTVELLGGRLAEEGGEVTLTLRPGEAFNRVVLGIVE